MRNTRFLLALGVLVGGAGLAMAAEHRSGETALTARGLEALAITRQALDQNPDLEIAPNLLLVRFQPTATRAGQDAVLSAIGGQIVRSYRTVPGLHLVAIDGDVKTTVALLSAMPEVRYAEPDRVMRASVLPNDPSYGNLWGMSSINAPAAWDVTTGDQNFVVAVIDTGVQRPHDDLAANMWTNVLEDGFNGIDDDNNGFIDDDRGWDFYQNDRRPFDTNGHGTHVAGTIGAVGNNNLGVVGVNWHISIMPIRFLGPNGTGAVSGAISAVEYATMFGVKVSNNSWGGGSSTALKDAIKASKDVGHIFVAAAGNDGNSQAGYPARYTLNNIISVAAVSSSDSLASFSNYNAISVDLGAPGVSIYSTYKSQGYAWLSGTSMATPHVTGVVALVYEQNPTMAFYQIRDKVFTTVRPVSSLSGKTVTGGVVDAADAVVPADASLPPEMPTRPTLTDLGGGSVQVDWVDFSANEDGFDVQRRELVGGTWGTKVIVATTGPNTQTLTDTPGAGTWRYRVRAINGTGESGWTPWRKITLN